MLQQLHPEVGSLALVSDPVAEALEAPVIVDLVERVEAPLASIATSAFNIGFAIATSATGSISRSREAARTGFAVRVVVVTTFTLEKSSL